MSEPSFKVVPTGRRQLSRAGNTVLYETAFRIERTSAEGMNVHITQQNLLSGSKSDDYISIRDARDMSKLSEEKLRELCENRLVESIRNGRDLLISRRSLARYIEENGTQ